MMKNIILIGMKACGKSTVGKLLAQKLGIKFVELDQEIEKVHFEEKKPTFAKATVGREKLTFREIFKKHGADYFHSLEKKVLKTIVEKDKEKQIILACGGGTPLDPENQMLLKRLGRVIFLNAKEDVLLPRILMHGVPAFFPYLNDPKKSLSELMEKRRPIYEKAANQIISFTSESPEELVEEII